MTMLPRHATEVALKRLRAFRVVVVSGARQVGKSTLARLILDRVPGRYLTLDDPLTLDEAAGDPDGLVAHAGGLTVIDEIQRVPELLRAIKRTVDQDPTPGRFLLTGSTNLLEMRTVTESLAGRAVYLDLLPLSWSEIVERPRPRSLDDAFTATNPAAYIAGLPQVRKGAAAEVHKRVLSGGMPEAFRLDADDRRAWYDSYRRTFLERDLRQMSSISNVPEFARLTSLSLLRTGGLLNRSDLAADAKVSPTTAERYLGLLQVACQIRLLQPYFPNVAKRYVKSPRIFAVDSGAAAWAANAWDWRAAAAAGKDGALLETWALSDVIAWDGLSGASRFHYWRTSAGAKVDLVIERGDEVVGLEIKASATLGRHDASGLRALRDDIGERFRLGIIAHLGSETRVIDRNIVAVPLGSFLGAE